ncbi:MAG: alpha/beta fold hydrolase, partial [Kordiimonas sp.]
MSSIRNLPVSSPMHRFNYHGFPVHMKQYGISHGGLPLVFIGGAFQNINQIEKLSNAFAKKTWVIAVDTPGNGDTGVLPHTYSFKFICEAINHCLVNELGVDRINLLGCSYGSIIAMRYAQMFPEIEHLVLGAAMDHLPKWLEYEFSRLLFLLEWNKREEFADGFTNLMTNSNLRERNRLAKLTGEKLRHALIHSTEGITEQFIHNTKRILADASTDLTLMPDIKTTVFTGEHDTFVPIDENKRVAAAFKRGKFVALKEADHMFH